MTFATRLFFVMVGVPDRLFVSIPIGFDRSPRRLAHRPAPVAPGIAVSQQRRWGIPWPSQPGADGRAQKIWGRTEPIRTTTHASIIAYWVGRRTYQKDSPD
jgi:hypothetical protein